MLMRIPHLRPHPTPRELPRGVSIIDPQRRRLTRRTCAADLLAWEDVAKFRDMWPGVLMLKGVNRSDDAIKALSYGIDGIVVSNHGGRNMDSAAASMEVLPEIAEAVGDKITVDPGLPVCAAAPISSRRSRWGPRRC